MRHILNQHRTVSVPYFSVVLNVFIPDVDVVERTARSWIGGARSGNRGSHEPKFNIIQQLPMTYCGGTRVNV